MHARCISQLPAASRQLPVCLPLLEAGS
jgi:hypothetical protein